jgi:hypothetical protein
MFGARIKTPAAPRLEGRAGEGGGAIESRDYVCVVTVWVCPRPLCDARLCGPPPPGVAYLCLTRLDSQPAPSF